MRAVRLQEHRRALIWCGYREGEKEKHHGRNRKAGVHEKKKIIFRLLVSEVEISTDTEAIRRRGWGLMSLTVYLCLYLGGGGGGGVPMRSEAMPGQRGWQRVGHTSAAFASQCPCTRQGGGGSPSSTWPLFGMESGGLARLGGHRPTKRPSCGMGCGRVTQR